MFFLTESEQTLLDSVGFLEVTDDLLDRMFPQESRLDHTQESRLDHTQESRLDHTQESRLDHTQTLSIII